MVEPFFKIKNAMLGREKSGKQVLHSKRGLQYLKIYVFDGHGRNVKPVCGLLLKAYSSYYKNNTSTFFRYAILLYAYNNNNL